MSRAVSPSVDRVYGLARVARCWRLSRATVYRHRQAPVVPKRRPGPVGPCDDATLLEHIKKAIAESRFTGEGYRKIWARLRFAGIRSSPGRVRRLMGAHGLLAPHRVRKRPDKPHDGTITTEAVDVLWGTDMTQTVTLSEGVAHVFVAVDHCNSECVGIHADKSANRFQALEPVRQGVRRHFGAIGKDVAAGLMLRHDHGSNYMSDDFQAEIAFLGIEASPSFVREPEGNGVAERRTHKRFSLSVRMKGPSSQQREDGAFGLHRAAVVLAVETPEPWRRTQKAKAPTFANDNSCSLVTGLDHVSVRHTLSFRRTAAVSVVCKMLRSA